MFSVNELDSNHALRITDKTTRDFSTFPYYDKYQNKRILQLRSITLLKNSKQCEEIVLVLTYERLHLV